MRYSEWERVDVPDWGPFLQRFPADAPESMTFKIVRDEWNEDPGLSHHNPEGVPERTVIEYELVEASR